MAKKVIAVIKLQIPAGAANPAPPVGPALGQHGVNIMEFCKAYNEQTASQSGMIIPVEIKVYEDRSFDFITKTPPAADLLKKAAGIEKASGEPHRSKVAIIPRSKVKEIAELKMRDLNATSLEGAMRIIEGTAKTMGIEVSDEITTAQVFEIERPKPKEPSEEEGGAEEAAPGEKGKTEQGASGKESRKQD